MELVNGITLQETLHRNPAGLSMERIIKYAVQLCDTLAYLHERPEPIIFRDLKPTNVMLDEYDNIQLIDFGIARKFKEGQQTDTIVLGTVAFASPEQLTNRQTDSRSDLYSLGSLLHYLLSGGQFYAPQFLHGGMIEQVSIPELAAIMSKLLHVDPSQRYQSAREVQSDLKKIRLPGFETTASITKSNGKYSVKATQTTPALIIYLIDTSGSMNLTIGGKRRIEVVREALAAAVRQMVFRSTKGTRLSGRYRLAILAYSDQVYDLLGGVKSIEEIGMRETLPELAVMRFSDAAKAFVAAEKLLQEEIPRMANCPAPLVCHMTDGAYTGEDPEPIVRRIMEMEVPDGNVLVENIFLDERVLEAPPTDLRHWKGITPHTQVNGEYAQKLKTLSSPMPDSYREMLLESSYAFEPGALMMLPGSSAELVALGFQLSAATPIR